MDRLKDITGNDLHWLPKFLDKFEEIFLRSIDETIKEFESELEEDQVQPDRRTDEV